MVPAFSVYSAEQRINVDITGVKEELLENIRAFLSIVQEKDNQQLTVARVRRLHQKAQEEILIALQPFGYYRPKIESELKTTEQGWQVSYHITPGEPVRVTVLKIVILGEGADDPKLASLVNRFPLQKDDVFVHSRYEDGKRQLLRLALNDGYLNSAYVEHQARVFPEKNSVEIRLTLATGIRYHFGRVTFSDAVVRQDLIKRFSEIREGEPYSVEKLFDLQNALFDSDYFSRVEITPQVEQAAGRRVPVFVELTPGKRHRYSAGVGYGTDTNVRGSLGYNNRRINRRGHRFRSTFRFSQLRESLSAGYIIPFRNPHTDQWGLTASLINDHPDKDREEDTYIVGVSRQISPRKNWIETLYLNYRRDSFRVGTEFGESNLLIPGVTIDRIKGRIAENIQTGNRLTLELRGGSEKLFSDVSFFQPLLTARILQKISKKGRFLLRGDIAATFINKFAELPLSLRYYAGGDTSVRGYGYQQLGPKNATGDLIGGKQKLVGSIEYDYRFKEKWSAAAFVDAGNAFDKWDDFTLERGAGVGMRWYSPVGPLRIDVAWPISETDKDPRLHIIFGPEL